MAFFDQAPVLTYVAAKLVADGYAAQTGLICSGQLSDEELLHCWVVEFDATKKAVVVVEVKGDANRAVAVDTGDLRLFKDSTTAYLFLRKLTSARIAILPIKISKSMGQPEASLKSDYLTAKSDKTTALRNQTVLADADAKSTSFGWKTYAAGTPQKNEADRIVAAKVVVDKWVVRSTALVTKYAAQLTAVGIDPLLVV